MKYTDLCIYIDKAIYNRDENNNPISLRTLTSEEDDDFDWTEELHKEEAGEEHIQHVIRAILKQAWCEGHRDKQFRGICCKACLFRDISVIFTRCAG